MIPLYGFLRGDTIGLIVLAEESDTMDDLANKLMAAASVRVRPRARGRVVFKDREVPPGETVSSAGMTALDRIDVAPAEDAP